MTDCNRQTPAVTMLFTIEDFGYGHSCFPAKYTPIFEAIEQIWPKNTANGELDG